VMRKGFAVLLAAVLLLCLTGCGIEDILSGLGEGSPAGVINTQNPALIGTWELVVEEEPAAENEAAADDNAAESDASTTLSDIDFGMGIEFTEDGKLRYGFDGDTLASVAGGADVNDLLGGMEMLMTIYYEVKSDTELELTVSALMGIQKETQTVEYALDGDTLVFDGETYTRVVAEE